MSTTDWGLDSPLMQALPSAVVAMDAEGCITALNPAAERLFGIASDQALGRPYPEIFGPSLADRIVGLFLHVARSGQAGQPHTVEASLPNGRRATLHANVGPLMNEGGQVAGILFAAEDHSAATVAEAEAHEQTAESDRLRRALRAYVDEAVASSVDARPSFTRLGGTRQVLSVLHADIRGYTTVAEERPPEEVMDLLLRYHGAAVPAIEAAGGLMDRYIGDAVLAMWNVPQPQETHARMALRGALAFQRATKAVGDEVGYGVGVHTGEAVVGNLGSDTYLHYTAIGDTVNVAARLQSAALAGEIICSVATLGAAGPGFRSVPLGQLEVKGRKGAVEAYRIEGLDA